MNFQKYYESRVFYHILPFLLFSLFFILYFHSAIGKFFTHFYGDNRDGSHCLWTIWWVKNAILSWTNLYFTDLIHYPEGVSLINHPLHATAGIIYLIVSPVLGLVSAYNFNVLLSFLLGGYGAFLLARYLKVNTFWSLVAGFIYAFSQNHRAHVDGHLHQTMIQWIPFFVLYFLKSLETLKVRYQLAALFFLILNMFTDFYFAFYSCLFCLIVFIYDLLVNKNLTRIIKKYLRLYAFIIPAILAMTSMSYLMHRNNVSENINFARDSEDFSMDFIAPFMWGERSMWWKVFYRAHRRFSGAPSEKGAYLGLTLLAAIFFAFIRRKRYRASREGAPPDSNFFKSSKFLFIMTVTFLILCMGPAFQWAGTPLFTGLPYFFIEMIVPPLKLSGLPLRFLVMVFLFWGLFVAKYLGTTEIAFLKKKRYLALFCLLLFIDYFPRPLFTTSHRPQGWMLALAERDDIRGGITFDIENFTDFRYQTIYKKPRATGFFGRVPPHLLKRENRIRKEFYNVETRNEFYRLMNKYKFDYIVYGKRGKMAKKINSFHIPGILKGSKYDLLIIK